MIDAAEITANLQILDEAFGEARSQRMSYLLSKLAILELCGWIEMSMDEVVLQHSDRTVSEESNRDFVKSDVVGRTFGFEYHKHYRKMLMSVAGMAGCEAVEKEIDETTHALFVSELGSLKTIRNQLAHTYHTGTAAQIDAPSRTRQRIEPLHKGLMEYGRLLKLL